MLEAKHKISIVERVMGLAGLGTREFTIDWVPEKKFSELSAWLRKLYRPGLVGKVIADRDVGGAWIYDYDHASSTSGWRVSFRVRHTGDYATHMTVEYHGKGASCQAKGIIRGAEKAIKPYEKKEKAEEAPAVAVETVDYKAFNINGLVEKMDVAVKEFGKAPSAATFAPIPQIKAAIEEKIDDMPLAKRAPFTKAMADMGLYVQAITTQLSMPMVDVSAFAGTYVPQMKAAIAAMAAEL